MMEHNPYPHYPGNLYDCSACESQCHCDSGTAECVYDGRHHTGANRYAAQIVGGASYSSAYPGEHVERFATLAGIVEWVRDLPYNDGVGVWVFRLPAGATTADAIAATAGDDPYPDYLVEVGPLGGVRCTRS